MNRFLCRHSLLLWLIVLALPPLSKAEQCIQVLSPPDMAAVDGKLITVVYRIGENFVDTVDTVRVTIDNDNSQPQPETIVKYDIRHSSFFLAAGKNRIRIKALKEGKTVAEKDLTVFLRCAISARCSVVPPSFAEYTFHLRTNESLCSPCHEQELRDGFQGQQVGARPPCYSCHRRIVDFRFAHGPASVWACATCHQGNSEKTKYATPDPEVIVCRMCHTDELAAWQSEKFGHGPTFAGKCAFCHNPHASDENFFLATETSELCGFCHEDKLTRPHLVTGFSGKGHPMRQESSQDGRRAISCASCHNPHAANNEFLLKRFKNSNTNFCRNCHF